MNHTKMETFEKEFKMTMLLWGETILDEDLLFLVFSSYHLAALGVTNTSLHEEN